MHLSYEDIAKLNPFYEECRSFWKTPSDATSSTYDASSSSSLRTLSSHTDSPFSSVDLTDSALQVHAGNQYNLSYDTHKSRVHSHVAIVEDEYHVQPLSFHKEAPDYHPLNADMRELELLENPLAQRRTAQKQLFGTNGWLGCTADLKYTPAGARNPKLATIKTLGKKIKQHVAGIVSPANPSQRRTLTFLRQKT